MKARNSKKVAIGVVPTQDVVTPVVTPVTSVTVSVPEEFKDHEKGMPNGNLLLAIELGKKFPGIVTEAAVLKSAVAEADQALGRMGQKYYRFCSELRKAKMNNREASLLMAALGFNKVRRSEIIKVSSVDDAIWAKFADSQISFKSTLALGRESEQPLIADKDGNEPGEEGYTETRAAKPVKEKAEENRLPKSLADALTDALNEYGMSLKPQSAKGAYVLRYENPLKRTYIVTVQPIDPSPAK